MNLRYSVILGFLGQLQDRFATYHEACDLAGKLALAAQIEGATAVEPVYPFDFQDVSITTFKKLLEENSLTTSSVNVNVKSEGKFHLGALTSSDPGIRAEAVEYVKAGMDLSAELGANLVTVCPLADGHDYPFQLDYRQAWRWLVECLAEAAEYRPDVRLSIEYKQSEPRAQVIVPNAGVTLYLCEQIGLDNVGLTVDTGHSLYVGETPAQVIGLTADANRLFLVHINDNYRNWDWDMMPGTVNYWDWLETLLMLDEVGYDGWLVSDVFPARLDPVEMLSACFRTLKYSDLWLDRFGKEHLRELVGRGEVIRVYDEFQELMLGGATSLGDR